MIVNKKRIIIGSVILLILIISIFYFVNGSAGDQLANMKIRYKEYKVEKGTFKVTVSANGIVRPIDRIEIKSKASGEIINLPVEQGDFVKKGDLIALLDQIDEKAEVAQSQADLDIARAELKQAQRTFNRREELFKDNLISEEERDQIELSLAVAKGKLIQANTALERAKERLSESTVRSPIDAIILQKYVEQGQIIASGVSNVGGGNPIVDLADMKSVYIEAGIDEIDIGKIKIGQEAVIFAEAYPNLFFKGKIVRIAPEAKIEQNVTLFDVVIEVENKENKLKSGMNTNIEITIIKKDDVLLAPTLAIQMENGQKNNGNKASVLLKKNNKFSEQNVKIGLTDFKNVEIISGLSEGDILGIPMTSRLKEENDSRENRFRSSRSFGT